MYIYYVCPHIRVGHVTSNIYIIIVIEKKITSLEHKKFTQILKYPVAALSTILQKVDFGFFKTYIIFLGLI